DVLPRGRMNRILELPQVFHQRRVGPPEGPRGFDFTSLHDRFLGITSYGPSGECRGSNPAPPPGAATRRSGGRRSHRPARLFRCGFRSLSWGSVRATWVTAARTSVLVMIPQGRSWSTTRRRWMWAATIFWATSPIGVVGATVTGRAVM